MDDLISRKEAIGRISTMFAPTPTQKDMVEDCLEIIDNLPSIDAVPTDSISRIEKELHGRDVEMQYEIIRWLWNYGSQFTDSRTAILQWLRGEES